MQLTDLPPEVLTLILARVPLTERLEVRLVSRSMRSLVEGCSLPAIRSLEAGGRSSVVRSVLDFVRDSKAKEPLCLASGNPCHQGDPLCCLTRIASFAPVARLITRHLTHLTFLRLHRLSLSRSGMRILMGSHAWRCSLQHVVIRSCYLDGDGCSEEADENEEREKWPTPESLQHLFYFTAAWNKPLLRLLHSALPEDLFSRDTKSGASISGSRDQPSWLVFERRSSQQQQTDTP